MESIQALLTNAINLFFQLLQWLILIRIIFSWLPMGHNSGLGGIIYQLTEPILGPARMLLDKSPLGGGMMLDFSPVIALFLMQPVQYLLLGLVNLL